MIKIVSKKYSGRNVLKEIYNSSIFVVYSLFIWIFFNFKNVLIPIMCLFRIFDRTYI